MPAGADVKRVFPRFRRTLWLADFDGDTNVELEAPFQTAALTRLLRQVEGDPSITRATWLYTDGTEGIASVEVTIDR